MLERTTDNQPHALIRAFHWYCSHKHPTPSADSEHTVAEVNVYAGLYCPRSYHGYQGRVWASLVVKRGIGVEVVDS